MGLAHAHVVHDDVVVLRPADVGDRYPHGEALALERSLSYQQRSQHRAARSLRLGFQRGRIERRHAHHGVAEPCRRSRRRGGNTWGRWRLRWDGGLSRSRIERRHAHHGVVEPRRCSGRRGNTRGRWRPRRCGGKRWWRWWCWQYGRFGFLGVETELVGPDAHHVCPDQDPGTLHPLLVDEGPVGARVVQLITLRRRQDLRVPAGHLARSDDDVRHSVATEEHALLAHGILAAVGKAHQAAASEGVDRSGHIRAGRP